MQNQEFDNLMLGQESKIAFLKPDSLEALQKLLSVPAQSKEDADDTTAHARKIIQKEEQVIPQQLRSQIDDFIKDLQNKRVKPRTIRRMVQRKFNITVV